MDCPKCKSLMEKVEYHMILVDRCSNCRGIWFDMLKAEKLKMIKGSETIDIGDPKLGRKYRSVDNISCPKCRTMMGKMVDNDQPHIWYELCPICYGTFFDAGEFRDYKENNILDFFKGLFCKARQ